MTFEEATERVPFLRALAPADRERLRPYAEVRHIPGGQAVWKLDDPLHYYIFLIEGHVKMTRPCENGREVILDVTSAGDLLCISAVSSFSPACCTSVAFDEGVVAIFLPRRDVLHVVEQSPPAAAAFVRESTGREARLAMRIAELASGQVEQRVAALLLHLADHESAVRENGHVRIPLHLSRQDLADLCGTTLESAIRTMSRLAREDVVTTAARGFIITDRARLEQLARGGLRHAP
ncbi:MAG TPA: Crp/Fnr family transcriptional regulator [Vicinamibacterales bacterium]|nr:Crp/Fnr family transcriptional regulator [Vicinamibacterales bacterium]